VQSGQRVIGASHQKSIKMSERVIQLREVERYRELDRIVIGYERYCEDLRKVGVKRKISCEEREQQQRYYARYCDAKEEKRQMEMTEKQRLEERRALEEEKSKKSGMQKIKKVFSGWKLKKEKESRQKDEKKSERGGVQQKEGGCVEDWRDPRDVLEDAKYQWDVHDYGEAAAVELWKCRREAERRVVEEEETRKKEELIAWERGVGIENVYDVSGEEDVPVGADCDGGAGGGKLVAGMGAVVLAGAAAVAVVAAVRKWM